MSCGQSLQFTVPEVADAFGDPSLRWDVLVPLSVRHGMESILYREVLQFGISRTPVDATHALRSAVILSTRKCSAIKDELSSLLAHFEKESVEVLALKGSVLAEHLYERYALRPVRDIDLLVAEDQLTRAHSVLACAGYEPYGSADLTDGNVKSYMYLRAGTSLAVELHRHLFEPFHSIAIDTEYLQGRLVSRTMSDGHMRVLRPEDLLLYLCIHGCKHRWSRLIWIVDVALLLRRHTDLPWDSLMEQANQYGCRRMLLLGVHLATDLLGARVPDHVYHQIDADRVIPNLARLVVEQLDEPKVDTLSLASFHISMRESIRDRIPYWMHMVRLAASGSSLAAVEEGRIGFSNVFPRMRGLWNRAQILLSHYAALNR